MLIENVSVINSPDTGIPIAVSLIADHKEKTVPIDRGTYYIINGTEFPSYLELMELLRVTGCSYVLLEGFSVRSISENLKKLFHNESKLCIDTIPTDFNPKLSTSVKASYDTLKVNMRAKCVKIKNRSANFILMLVETVDRAKDLMLLNNTYNKIISDDNKIILFMSENLRLACGLENNIKYGKTALSEIAFFNVESDGSKIINLKTKKFKFTESVILDGKTELHCLDLLLLNDSQTYVELKQTFQLWVQSKLFRINSYTIAAINISSLQIINNSMGVEYGDRCISELINAIRMDDVDCIVYHHHATGTTFYVSSLTPLQARVVLEGLYRKLHNKFTWIFELVSFAEVRPHSPIDDVLTFSDCLECVSTRLLWEKVTTKGISSRLFKSMLEHRTLETKDHCTRIQHASLAIAHVLSETERFTQEQLSKLGMGAMLHDLGKLYVPPEILNKTGKLSEDEFNIIKQHPVEGANTFLDDKVHEDVYLIIRHHHERYDGKGYPDGKSLKDLPLTVAIVSFVDTVDAILSNRCYKEAKPLSYLFEEIERCNGTQFHPKVVSAFKRAYELGMMDGLLNIENKGGEL